MLVNWKVHYCEEPPEDLQPPDYYCDSSPYWFFRYFKDEWDVDVVDTRSLPVIETFEKNILRFYIIQTLRVLPRLTNYDVIISHGMQSGVLLSLYRRLFRTRAKHVVFDIGSFASASESGFSLRLMQFASKSIDGLIYHTSSQIAYYRKYFPWLVNKTKFIPFGTDLEYFTPSHITKKNNDSYILCVGYNKRDWKTVVEAYRILNTNVKLRMIGHVDECYRQIRGVQMLPFLPIKQLQDQIEGALFCVLPLREYNYSYGQMTLMQQMALNKCVVAARVSSIVDYVEDGKSAILYTPGDINDCASKMSQVLYCNTLRLNIANNARSYLESRYNEIKMAQDIETYLKKTLGLDDIQ